MLVNITSAHIYREIVTVKEQTKYKYNENLPVYTNTGGSEGLKSRKEAQNDCKTYVRGI